MILRFAMAALATYRLSRMVALEEGPSEAFLSLRSWVCEQSNNGSACKGITCPLCLSVWVGLAIAVTENEPTPPIHSLLRGLAYSAIATIIHRLVG